MLFRIKIISFSTAQNNFSYILSRLFDTGVYGTYSIIRYIKFQIISWHSTTSVYALGIFSSFPAARTALQLAFFALPMIPVLSTRSFPAAFTIHNTKLSLHRHCKVYQQEIKQYCPCHSWKNMNKTTRGYGKKRKWKVHGQKRYTISENGGQRCMSI